MRLIFKIHELGPIRDSEFEFHPLLIFTGDSNVGKSYANLLFYSFCKLLRGELFYNYLADFYNIDDLFKEFLEKKEAFFEITYKDIEVFYEKNIQKYLAYLLGYENINVNISLKIIDNNNDILNVNLKDEYGNKILYISDAEIEKGYDIRHELKNFPNNYIILLSVYTFILERITNNYYHYERNFIFPPAKGVLISSSYSIQKKVANMGMYENFLEDMDIIKAPYIFDNNRNTFLLSKINDLLEGKIEINRNEIDYVSNEVTIPISAAASSIKELAPLFLLLNKFNANGISLLIEEPESHLHPDMQRKVATILAGMVHEGGAVQVTTHSGYILNQLNLLIMLSIIEEKYPERFEEALNIVGVSKEFVLSYKKVGTYYFERQENGFVSIIKKEIDANHTISFDSFKKVVNELSEQRFLLTDILEP